MGHKKHADITRRNNGNFAPNEIAILGSKCSIISQIVQKTGEKLKKKHKTAYFDASHDFDKKAPDVANFTFNKNGFVEQIHIQDENPYNLKIAFNNYDLVFVNGNHYQAAQQVLILDPEKEASVRKRLDQLTNIQFIITLDKDMEFFDFLIEKYPDIENLHCYTLDEEDKIAQHFERILQAGIAKVSGLILIGGKSTRMGTDKSLLDYHGKPQYLHLKEVLGDTIISNNIYYSVRDEKQLPNEQVITDKFKDLGPFGGICSAFMYDPNAAWLVLATDLPFVNNETISTLLKHRNPSKVATTFKGKSKKFPEPLITIWEPKAYAILLNYLSQGYSCPRKVLINNDVEIIEIDDKIIENANSKKDYELALHLLQEK